MSNFVAHGTVLGWCGKIKEGVLSTSNSMTPIMSCLFTCQARLCHASRSSSRRDRHRTRSPMRDCLDWTFRSGRRLAQHAAANDCETISTTRNMANFAREESECVWHQILHENSKSISNFGCHQFKWDIARSVINSMLDKEWCHLETRARCHINRKVESCHIFHWNPHNFQTNVNKTQLYNET